MNLKRTEQVAARRVAFPRKYRRLYDRAVEGKSLRACVNAQCLDCCAGQSNEVALCTDLACPLWAVRPYRVSGNSQDGGLIAPESTNAHGGNNDVG